MQREALDRASDRMKRPHGKPKRVDTDRPFASKPGALRGESTVTIKTRLAQQLVFGRQGSNDPKEKRAIIGLVGFAGMLKQIYTGAKLDDPYADKWLLDIEESINRSMREIGELRSKIEAALSDRKDFQHTVAQSVEPIEVPLYFSNQFPFRAAYLVNDFDNLVCAALTAKHVAVLPTNEANAIVHRASKAVRRALSAANGYKYTGVSRADIAHGTAKAEGPISRWGALSKEVLNGSRRAEYGPPLSDKSFAHQFAEEAAEVNGAK